MSTPSRHLFLTALLAAVSSGLVACNFYKEKGGGANAQFQTDPNAAARFGRPLGYALVRDEVFTPFCIRCHGEGKRTPLATYEQIVYKLDAIQNAVFVKETMPRGGPLDPDAKALLWNWIQSGAPVGADDEPAETPAPEPTAVIPPPPAPVPAPTAAPAPPPAPAPSPAPAPALEPTFASLQANVFSAMCAKCHNDRRAAGKISFDSYDSLTTLGGDFILRMTVAGDPDSAPLIEAVAAADPAERMPPARTGMTASPEQIAVMREWIRLGAPR